MRIATIVLSVFALLPFTAQAFIVYNISADRPSVSLVLSAAILGWIAVAFIWGKPIVALVCFALGASLCLLVSNSDYADVRFWTWVLGGLCAMCLLAIREAEQNEDEDDQQPGVALQIAQLIKERDDALIIQKLQQEIDSLKKRI